MHPKIFLASDNWAAAHPSILQAMEEANKTYAPSYGQDPWTQEAEQVIQNAFKTRCKVFIVPTGTGANIFGLKIACQRHESVLCTDIAHIQYQESGAAESIIGCKLLSIPHLEGKITPHHLLKKIQHERAFGKHSTSPRVLSITQPTEVGTVYTLEELATLSKICKEENLWLHMDGSRLYNAVVSLQTTFHEIVQTSQLDLLSLGGTKNGLVNAEALLIFAKALERGSDHLHKQTLQLLSKMRYLSVQYLPFFKNTLWHSLALHANQKAQEIASIIKSTPHLSLNYPVETNQLFFSAPPSWIPLLQEKIFCHIWDRDKNEIRLITSWSTTEQDVKALQSIFSQIAKEPL